MGTSISGRVMRFGPFEADVRLGELRKQGRKIRLQDQPFQILLMLLEHPGELVTREQLRQKLWPADTFVDFDHGLNNAVNRLREALCESSDRPRYIETLPKRGYRFVAAVNGPVNTEPASSPGQTGKGLEGSQGAIDLAAASDSQPVSKIRTRRVLPEFPEKFVEIIDKSVERDRDTRYQHVSAPGEWALESGTGQAKRQAAWYGRVALAAAAVVALLLLGIVAYNIISKSTKPRGTLRVTRVTNGGNAQQAAISPDAKFVAYFQSEKSHAGSSLWLQQIGTSIRTRLLPESERPEGYEGLRFSPDGGYLYYTRIEPNSSTRSLYRVSVLGGTPEKVLANVPGHFALSPDGRSVAHIGADPVDGREALVVVSINASSEKVIARLPEGDEGFSDPAWSHDGKLLAVVEHVQGKKLSRLLIIPLDGGPGRRITSDEFSIIGEPAWLTDGSGLLATAFGRWVLSNEQLENEAKYDQLWEFPYSGRNPRRILNDFLRYHGPISVSADSSLIATVASDLVSAVWVGPASDPDRVRPVTPLSGHYVANRGITWTGSGKIVYWTNASDAFDFILMDADGGNPRTLPRHLHYVMHPEGCSDGHTMVYTGVVYPHKRHVMRWDLDGGRPQALATGAFPQCSPDSKWVVYYDDMVSGVPQKIPMEGGQPVPLMEEECWRAGVSPNGRWVACVHETGKLAITPFSGGNPVKMFDLSGVLVGVGSPLRWTPDSQNVVYAVGARGSDNLWAQPVAGGPPRALTHFSSQGIYSFAFSHDGKQIAISRGTSSSDVVLISNFR